MKKSNNTKAQLGLNSFVAINSFTYDTNKSKVKNDLLVITLFLLKSENIYSWYLGPNKVS